MMTLPDVVIGVLAAGVLYVLTGLLTERLRDLADRLALSRENYRQRRVPTAGGLALLFPLAALVGLAHALNLVTLLQVLAGIAALALLAVGGLLDDVSGVMAREPEKGWKGHVGAFVHTRRLTSGLWKIMCGGLAGVVAATAVQGPALMVQTLLLVPLGANTLNLLDLRPGRSAKAFLILLWLGAMVSLLIPAEPTLLLVAVAATAVTLAFVRYEMRERLMLGDTGANLLGGFLGLAASFMWPRAFRLSLLGVFVMTQIVTERLSLSTIIQNNGVLRWVDSLGKLPITEKSEARGHEQEEHGVRQRI